MCSLKALMLNLFYPRYMSMLKPLDLYMLVTVWISLMILSVLFEIQFSAVSKVILDNFLCRKLIPFIFKNQNLLLKMFIKRRY